MEQFVGPTGNHTLINGYGILGESPAAAGKPTGAHLRDRLFTPRNHAMRYVLCAMLCLSSAIVAAQDAPPEALHFPKEEFDAFVLLSETEFDTQAQWDAWGERSPGAQAIT